MKLTLGKKLGLSFGVVLALLVASAALGFLKARNIRLSEEVAFAVRVPSLKAAIQLQRDLNQTQVKGRQTILAGTQPERLADAKKLFAETWSDVEKDIAGMNELAPKWANQDRDRLQEIKQQLVLLRQVQEDAIKRASSGEKDALAKAGNESADHATPINRAMKKSLGSMAESFDKQVDQNKEELQADNRALKLTMFATSVVALGVGICVAIFLSRSISAATHSVLCLAEAVAAGDLTGENLRVRSHDELGELAIAINKMNDNLKRMLRSISENSLRVASASEELSSSATLQAQGADTQKDQVTRIATAMQEMSTTVQQVSENCLRAAEASSRAAQTAREGGTVVKQALTQMHAIAESVGGSAKEMGELGKSSEHIGRIASVIDDIADQTNLLALNAAIEAARAGEQGRGFAVVADEVRKLAERTTTATKEIAEMIKTIQSGTSAAAKAMEGASLQVEQGVASTERAGDSLQQIIKMSEQVGAMIGNIATGATEQSAATAEINRNMDQIASQVKESTVGAQESAKACQDLSDLASDLQSMVGSFKLEAGSENRRTSGAGVPNRSRSHRNEDSPAPKEESKAFAAAAR
jgi:methyl-accepting chemotaxis protein